MRDYFNAVFSLLRSHQAIEKKTYNFPSALYRAFECLPTQSDVKVINSRCHFPRATAADGRFLCRQSTETVEQWRSEFSPTSVLDLNFEIILPTSDFFGHRHAVRYALRACREIQ
jgi:hypothetical protein